MCLSRFVCRDGCVEIEPAPVGCKGSRKVGLSVAVAVAPGEPLKNDRVRRIQGQLRGRACMKREAVDTSIVVAALLGGMSTTDLPGRCSTVDSLRSTDPGPRPLDGVLFRDDSLPSHHRLPSPML